MTSDEVVDLGFRHGVHVLELVHSRKLGDVQTIRDHSICRMARKKNQMSLRGGTTGCDRKNCERTGLSLEKMLSLVSGNVRNGGEHIGTMRRTSLDAVSERVMQK